jgi:hypothetical protein
MEKLRQQLFQVYPLVKTDFGPDFGPPAGEGGVILRVCLWGAGANVGKAGGAVDGVEDWVSYFFRCCGGLSDKDRLS